MISSNSEWALSVADDLSPAAELLLDPPLTSSSTVSRAEKLALPRRVRLVLNFLAGGSMTSLSGAGGGGGERDGAGGFGGSIVGII